MHILKSILFQYMVYAMKYITSMKSTVAANAFGKPHIQTVTNTKYMDSRHVASRF